MAEIRNFTNGFKM